MTDTIARLRSGKLVFETMVDLDAAMQLRKGESISMNDVVRDTAIYTDVKKGMHAGRDELENVFGTTNVDAITEKIVRRGEIEVTQTYRDDALEAKRKQIITFLTRNAIDVRTQRPFTPDILESALKESGVRVDNTSIEQQISRITETLKKVIPIKVETKKLKIKIPAEHTGKVYGLVNEYKEREEWLSDGSLDIVVSIPIGIQSEFYDKLNNITHGSALTAEMKE